MRKDNFDMDMNEATPKEKPFSFNDLDLGVDFDLSFLDDIDESVLEEETVVEPKPAAPERKPAPPVKKEAPAAKKQAPAAKKEAAVKKEAPARKAATPSSGAPRKAPAKNPATPVEAAEGKKTAPAKKAPTKKPAVPAREAPVKEKKKKGPRLGGVIFYTLYFMFILVFFIGTYIGLQWLHGWLTDFEAAQPTVKAEQVFREVFTDPNWGDLYESAGAQDSAYEGKEEYVNYMENKVGDTALTYQETSSGLAKDTKKYLVYLGEEKVASFSLVDKNKVGDKNLENVENLEDITKIPDWELGAVEVFFERVGTYRIVKLDGHTAYVNGVALDDSFTVQIATTKAEEYLPEGTTGASMCTQEISGLMEMPEVKVTDKDGKEMAVTYDEATATFTERTESNTITEEQQKLALDAAKTRCLWMIEEVKDRGEIAKYYDPSFKPYNDIIKTSELWMQDHNGYKFIDEKVDNFASYGDNMFSVHVSMNLQVTRTNGTVKDNLYEQSLFFHKTEAGKWLVFNSTNEDVSEPVGKVRLTFKQGDKQLTTDFYNTDAREIITPMINVPEGQVFTGWVTIGTNENGATVYNLEFEPDPATGKVSIPAGTTLKPMTLYAYFEDAATAAAEEAEEATTPDVTTPVETAPVETDPAETIADAE